jgi:hypothetical protein
MKPKLLLCLALVLSGGWFGLWPAHAEETNVPVSTNLAQIYIAATLKTKWPEAKVTLYRTTGGTVQPVARHEIVTVIYGPHTNDWGVLAFVDPETGYAWIGSGFDAGQMFYLETESGIVRGEVDFAAMALGAPRPDQKDVANGAMAYGDLYWDRSLVPKVERGENIDAVIEQFNKTNGLQAAGFEMRQERSTVLENSLQGVETGLNPWLFQIERQGSRFKMTTVEAVEVSDGKVRLDLKNPTGSHQASVWIDLKTWQVVKTIQDGKP